MSEMGSQILQPAQWSRPRGYSNGIVASGRQIFVAGQIGWDAHGRFTSERLADQVRQTLENICTVLAQAQAGPEHIVRLTWYVTSRDEYHAELADIGAAYRAVMSLVRRSLMCRPLMCAPSRSPIVPYPLASPPAAARPS